jgi:serpin B
VAALDFTSQSAVNTINNWVSTQTNGKIPKIVNQISSDDIMYLVNAIYFKSTWKEKFDPAATKALPFHLTDGSQVNANFMDGKIDLNWYYDNAVSVYELPYANSKYSMVIAMPTAGTSISQFVTGLDFTKWQTWMSGLHATNAEIKIPKFQFSFGVNLNTPLSSLGLGIAFSNLADFTDINPAGGLQITNVEHKAFVDIDESGTTAAAVTSVTVGISAVYNPPPAVLDHPFVFAIREMSSGIILFVGTVNNPTLTGE